jgi:hypothetical protein
VTVHPPKHFFKKLFLIFVPYLFVFVYFVFNCPFASYRTACCGFFHFEKSDGFGRERTRDFGFQGPARKPLDHRSTLNLMCQTPLCAFRWPQYCCARHTVNCVLLLSDTQIDKHINTESINPVNFSVDLSYVNRFC